MADLAKILCENFLKAFKLTKGDSMKGKETAQSFSHAVSAGQIKTSMG